MRKESPGLFYDTWYVIGKGDAFLKLGRCGTGSNVRIHLYPHKHGGYLVSTVSVLGNRGQSQVIRFFRVAQNRRIVKQMKQHAVGLHKPKENEFLDVFHQFPEDRNEVVGLYTNDDGAIRAIPKTWLPRDLVMKRFVVFLLLP